MNLEQYLQEAKRKEKQGQLEEAILDYEKAKVLDANNKEIVLSLSRLYLFKNKPIQSLEILYELPSIDHDADYLLQLSSTYMALQRFEDAYRILLDAVHSHPTPPLLNNLGVVSIRLNKKKEAIEYLSRSLDLENKNPNTWINLATFYEAQSDFDTAIAVLKKAILQLQHPEIYERLALALSRKRQFDEAINAIEDGLRQYSDQSRLMRSKLKILFMSEQYDECLKYIEWLESEKAADLEFRKEMLEIKEQVFFHRREIDQCLNTLDDLIQLSHESPVYFLRKAFVFLSQKNFRSALEWATKLLKLPHLAPNLRSEGVMLMKSIELENWKLLAYMLFSDPIFKDAMRQNPVYAIQSRGILLPEEGMAQIIEWLKNPSSPKFASYNDGNKNIN